MMCEWGSEEVRKKLDAMSLHTRVESSRVGAVQCMSVAVWYTCI